MAGNEGLFRSPTHGFSSSSSESLEVYDFVCSECRTVLASKDQVCVVLQNSTRHVCILEDAVEENDISISNSGDLNKSERRSGKAKIVCRNDHMIGSRVMILKRLGAPSMFFLDGRLTAVHDKHTGRFDSVYNWKLKVDPTVRISSDEDALSSRGRTPFGNEKNLILFGNEMKRKDHTIRVKVQHSDTTKVITVSKSIKYHELLMTIKSTFPELFSSSFQLKYQDEDGDLITLDSDSSLKVWIQENSYKPSKLFIDNSRDASSSFFSSFPSMDNLSSPLSKKDVCRTEAKKDAFGIQNEKKGSSICRHFAKGHCRYGSSCSFLHSESFTAYSSDSPSPSIRPYEPPSSVREMNQWISRRESECTSDCISNLTKEKGLKYLNDVLNLPSLPHSLISRLVSLLSSEEMRTSLMKESTNKIYGSVLGSRFLLQLASHIQSLPSPSAKELHLYVKLCEEVQSRTSDGWKQVPLDACKSRAVNLPESMDKFYLMDDIRRLIRHRDRMRTSLNSTAKDDSLKCPTFRTLPIIPSEQEMQKEYEEHFVPVNRTTTAYPSLNHYLETHFMLLREDCIEPLRMGILNYRNHSHGREVRVYNNVRMAGMNFGKSGLEYRVSFTLPSSSRYRTMKEMRWESSRRLMYGSLLCMSCDNFLTIQWAIVCQRDIKLLENGQIGIRMLSSKRESTSDEKGNEFLGVAGMENEKNDAKDLKNVHKLDPLKVYVMLESSSAYFEAYSHVLKSLQRIEMERLPFQRHLVHLDREIHPPKYLLTLPPRKKDEDKERCLEHEESDDDDFDDDKDLHCISDDSFFGMDCDSDSPRRMMELDRYEMNHAFPEMTRSIHRSWIKVLDPWPMWESSLDASQKEALQRILSKELALVQGPPGTGKTYIGLLAMKILLNNVYFSPDVKSPFSVTRKRFTTPILVVCYTNHALDQFLEGILESEKDVVRIGGQSKNEGINSRNLRTLLMKKMEIKANEKAHYEAMRKAKDAVHMIENDITLCVKKINEQYVNVEDLHNVATEEQIEQLLLPLGEINDQRRSSVVELWLEMKGFIQYNHSTNYELSSEMNDEDDDDDMPTSNSFQVLADEHETEELEGDEEEIKKEVEDRIGDENKMNEKENEMIQFHHLDKNDDINSGDGWREVGYRGGNKEQGYVDVGHGYEPEYEYGWDECDEDEIQQNHEYQHLRNGFDAVQNLTIETIVDYPYVWSLDFRARHLLHNYWLDEIKEKSKRELAKLTEEYEEARRKEKEVENEMQLAIIRKCKVVGMTTTAASRYHDLLMSLKPEIVVVEEAAEVLEGHIISCLSPFTKHLILIGDHLQLRPSVAVYQLASKHKLDVSMFERLALCGLEHTTLGLQRRMRPEISRLISSIYPNLKDHPSVFGRPHVKGMRNDVFFFHHTHVEDSRAESGSKCNSVEADLVVEFCMYLLKQGYEPSQVTILTMYTGQLLEIKRRLREKFDSWRLGFGISTLPPSSSFSSSGLNIWEKPQMVDTVNRQSFPRVSSVDNYQGEECDIILLSLVRSNDIEGKDGPGTIGFLNIPNRVCVALSRAKTGLYMFGNAELLSLRSSLWNKIINGLKERNEFGTELSLVCQNHENMVTRIKEASDFSKVADGGCSLPCELQLDCGHVCPRRCHPGSHDDVLCFKPCMKPLPNCEHQCTLSCHGLDSSCPPCRVIVSRIMPQCEHTQRMECSKSIGDHQCTGQCKRLLECGHRCPSLCYKTCPKKCRAKVKKVLDCGHEITAECSQSLDKVRCRVPCGAIISECGHKCSGTCSECMRGTKHVPCRNSCKRILPCSHACRASCGESCPPCRAPCLKMCRHSKCRFACGWPCVPCRERCAWRCPHHRCDLACHEVCQRPRCNIPCYRWLRCGHQCIGLCGELCLCKECNEQAMDVISQVKLKDADPEDRFIRLFDCGHIFEVSGIDTWMDMPDEVASQEGTGSTAIKLKECPACRIPIRRTLRYCNVVKHKLNQIEEVKRRILGFDSINSGNFELQKGNPENAVKHYENALKLCSVLPDAHYGLGCAFTLLKRYDAAIERFRLVVRKSPINHRLSDALLNDPISPSPTSQFLRRFQEDTSSMASTTSMHNLICSRTTRSLALKSMYQWATVLTLKKDFANATRVVDAILVEDPTSQQAFELKEKMIKREEIRQVVEAMIPEIGGRGHWYQCPNGHYYTIGECGGAMQESTCPECRETIGGRSHTLARGNRHSDIDGSSHSAWSNAVGLGAFAQNPNVL